jgi:signal transduction histidine kinase
VRLAVGSWQLAETAFAAAGWVLAVALCAALLLARTRLELVARAEHELRGPVTVLSLAAERVRRDPMAGRHGPALESELERLRIGLADLVAARRGRRARGRSARVDAERLVDGALAGWRPVLAGAGRAARLDWRAGRRVVEAHPGRLAQVLGNLLANAAEHGDGPVEIRGRSLPGGVRVEVRNSAGSPPGRAAGAGGRGRGIPIAAAAAEDAGGRLEVAARDGAVVAALELPAEVPDAAEEQPPAAA